MIARNHRSPRWPVALLVGIVLMLSGCSAEPPKALDVAASSLSDQIENDRKALDKARSDFDAQLKQNKYSFLNEYAPAERHTDRFDQAKTKLDEAKKVLDKEVKPIVDDYEDGKKASLEAAIGKANALRGEAQTLMRDPAQWADKVVATKADPEGTVKNATAALTGMKTDYDALSKRVETTQNTYARNKAAIGTAFQPLSSQYSDALQANGLLQAEATKNPPNYAVMTTHSQTVATNAAAYGKDAPAFKSRLGQLDDRETHTLVDIKVDSAVEISRTSWDDSYDWPDEHSYDYPAIPVDLDTANYFAQFGPDDVLAKETSGWGGGFKHEKVDQNQWKKLGIESKKDWPKGDTDAEFYVELDETYCHQVLIWKNGKPGSAPEVNHCSKYDTAAAKAEGKYWVEADDLDAELIGMDIYAKGAGDFNDQATTEGTPPGMAYVGDPQTGEWREDSNGNTFWHYYGQYAFISQLIGGPNSYHYRSEYDTWNRDYRYRGRPYYAPMNGKDRYGLKSPLVTSRFPGSTFVSSGLHNSTVRGAGPAARSGGPGNGGK